MKPYAPYPLDLLRDWFHRRRRWIRVALAIVLVPYLSHFVYTRWTAMPPVAMNQWNEDAGLLLPPPELDRTKDLVAAIKALPLALNVAVPTTAPAGHRWVEWKTAKDWSMSPGGPDWQSWSPPPPGRSAELSLSIAFVGKWEPDRRLLLRAVIDYLEQPATSDTLERIASLSSEPFCLTSRSGLGQTHGLQVRQLAWLLTARIRYHMAEKGDFESATEDVRTLLQFIAGYEDDRTTNRIRVGMVFRELATNEIMSLAREFALTREQTQPLIQWLEAHPYDARRAWALAVEGERAGLGELLDYYYTDDGSGNGRFVLYRVGEGEPDYWILHSYNLLSPLFDDRQTAGGIFAVHFEQLAKIGPLRYSRAKVILDRLEKAQPPTVMPDLRGRFTGTFLGIVLGHQAEHSATITSLALSAYKTEHGHYPEDLAVLVPGYMSTLPIDPFVDKPMRYRLDDRDGYVLYSVGQDLTDDGGVYRDETGAQVDRYDRKDALFPGCGSEPCADHREEPYGEWVLIPYAGPDGTLAE